MPSNLRAIAAIVALAGCTGSESDGGGGGECTSGKCDGFGGAEVLSTFTQTVANGDTIPRGFTTIGDHALFFSAAKRGLWTTDGTAAGTKLVRDLAPTLDSYQTTPRIAVLGGKAYWSFMGTVWASDGTAGGTSPVIDFGYQPSGAMTDVVVLSGQLLFGVNKQLWTSDGTTAGTHAVSNIEVVGAFQIAGSSLYFACNRADVGQELCVTDGTDAGTRLVKDVRPGIQGTGPRFLGASGSLVWFSAQTEATLGLRSLWVTDGSDAGTVQLMAPASNSDAVSQYAQGAVLGNRLFVPCYTSSTAFELCASDGTPAGTTVLDLAPGSASSAPDALQVLGDRLVFVATSPTLGRELWISDGTVAGSSVLVDLRTTTNDKDGVAGGPLVPFGNTLLFGARGPDLHRSLWRTDGTAAGTVKVASPLPDGVPERYGLSLADAAVIGDKLVFAADDGTHGLEPWVTDGTAGGTELVLDVTPPARDLIVSDATTFGNGSYFAIGDSNAMTVWRTNGTAGGTASFQQLEAQVSPGLTVAGSTLYFRGQSSLWKSDGTSAVKVRDLPGSVDAMVAFGNQLAFVGTTSNQGYGLWLSDGTSGGTVETSAVNAERLAAASGRLWLTALIGSGGNELWTSDGTVAGTQGVADINPSGDSKPGGFVGLGGKTIFAATEHASGNELWTTDGTAAGTQRLVDLAPGSASSSPFGMFAWNGMVLFWARPATAYELWRTDGTAAGTARVKAISYGSGAYSFTAWGNYVFFTAADDAGTELWRTDGTEAGTVRVADLYAGAQSSNPAELALAGPNGPLYFVAEEPLGGREIWKLDTPDGAPSVAVDVLPGPRSSSPSHLQPRGDALLFIADDGHGPAMFRLGPEPDVVAPTITCPHDMTIEAADATGAVVTFALPSASDNNGAATVKTTPASGDVFPVGMTTVTAVATDAASNTASCTFAVTVAYQGGGSGSGSGSGSGGGSGSGSGSADPMMDNGGGGGCSATGTGSPLSFALLLVAGAVRRRRRR